MQVKIHKLYDGVLLPEYATPGAACFDIRWFDPENKVCTFSAGAILGTGLQFEIPEGYALMLYSRSGHGFNHGVRLANCVGVIDSDYRGEVKVKLTSDALYPMKLKVGDRIAQGMIIPVQQVSFVEAELTKTLRDKGGMGSTGA